jgi:phosphotransferase system enzyme I (PtsI)
MSLTLHGIGVASGIAIGRAHLASAARIEAAHFVLPRKHIGEELARFDEAIAITRAELEALRDHIPGNAPAELSAFLDIHLMLLADSMIAQAPKQLIRDTQCNAEWALTQQVDKLAAQFDSFEDDYLKSRKEDVVQVAQRVLKTLMGHPGHLPTAVPREGDAGVLVAHDLAPADMILFKKYRFAAFTTDLGGATSHTAILARSLNIPSVVALHHARTLIQDNEWIIVDGDAGVVIVNPDPAVLEEYRLRQSQKALETQKLKRLSKGRATTLDGVEIELQANIELPQDVDAVREAGATGIGLFRTEFLFMNRADLPSEDEQFEAYREVAVAMKGQPVTLRTLDLGADKTLTGVTVEAANPALGLRAIRLCLAEPALFLTQLRAILRASAHGKVRILLPMLSSVTELNQARAFIAQAREQLDDEGTDYDRSIAIGGMIEIPAAALSARAFADKLDYLSIGTNDLIQYTLAIDRTDDSVAHLFDPLHPAVLQLIHHTLRVGVAVGKPVAVCGEMAGDPTLTRLLLGLGLRVFSMHPANLLQVKQQVLTSTLSSLASPARRLLKSDDPERSRALLRKLEVRD